MIKKGIFTVLILYIMLVSFLTFFQEKFIFLPTQIPLDYTYTFTVPFEEFFLEAKDGAQLNAIHFKVANPKGVILYFHGNAGDLSRWGIITSEFTKYQYDVIVMDYRTYGKSFGKLNEKNLYADAQLFYDYTKERFQESEIILYGRSLGTSFATRLAAENNPNLLILEAPFYNLKSVAKRKFPYLPVGLLTKYHFMSNEYIQSVQCKTVIIHGAKDQVVPFSSGKKLFENTNPRTDNLFIEIPEGEHNNLSKFNEYIKVIDQLLKN